MTTERSSWMTQTTATGQHGRTFTVNCCRLNIWSPLSMGLNRRCPQFLFTPPPLLSHLFDIVIKREIIANSWIIQMEKINWQFALRTVLLLLLFLYNRPPIECICPHISKEYRTDTNSPTPLLWCVLKGSQWHDLFCNELVVIQIRVCSEVIKSESIFAINWFPFRFIKWQHIHHEDIIRSSALKYVRTSHLLSITRNDGKEDEIPCENIVVELADE